MTESFDSMMESTDRIETIWCAAIRTADGFIYSVPRPGRHEAVIQRVIKGRGSMTGAVQGFMTNGFRFVDRIEAKRIALTAKQVEEKNMHAPAQLYSEDLW